MNKYIWGAIAGAAAGMAVAQPSMGVWGKTDGSEPEARPQTPDFGMWPTKEGSSQRGQEADTKGTWLRRWRWR